MSHNSMTHHHLWPLPLIDDSHHYNTAHNTPTSHSLSHLPPPTFTMSMTQMMHQNALFGYMVCFFFGFSLFFCLISFCSFGWCPTPVTYLDHKWPKQHVLMHCLGLGYVYLCHFSLIFFSGFFFCFFFLVISTTPSPYNWSTLSSAFFFRFLLFYLTMSSPHSLPTPSTAQTTCFDCLGLGLFLFYILIFCLFWLYF